MKDSCKFFLDPDELKYHYDTLQSFLKSEGKIITCEHCPMTNEITSPLKGVTLDKHPTMPALQKALESTRIVLDYMWRPHVIAYFTK